MTSEDTQLLFSHATEFEFRYNKIHLVRICFRDEIGGNRFFAVCDRLGRVLNNAFEWEHEPLPSNRSEKFIGRTRFDLNTTLQMVKSFIQEEDRG